MAQWLGRGRVQLTTGSDLATAAEAPKGPAKGTELTSGSSLDVARQGAPWPEIIDGAYKFFVGWRRNNFRQVFNRNVEGNYGALSSRANYGFKASEYAGVGLTPGPMPVGTRPMYDNLIPILWGLRVVDPMSQAQLSELTNVEVVQIAPAEYTPPANASLLAKAEVLQ